MRKSKDFNSEEILKNASLKNTAARRRILEILQDSKVPLDIDSILKKFRSNKADKTTIYRALTAFAEQGLVQALSLGQKKVSYEFIKGHHHAHHLICKNCGLVEVIPFCVKNLSASALKKSKKFKNIKNHRLEFFGSCKSCVRTVR